ncbi:MAG: hypothetical protein QOF28_1893, partial [Actinomycetota bacterium]|nr:hypothetical protein [Actinomycetota bacterium]
MAHRRLDDACCLFTVGRLVSFSFGRGCGDSGGTMKIVRLLAVLGATPLTLGLVAAPAASRTTH